MLEPVAREKSVIGAPSPGSRPKLPQASACRRDWDPRRARFHTAAAGAPNSMQNCSSPRVPDCRATQGAGRPVRFFADLHYLFSLLLHGFIGTKLEHMCY